MAEGTHWYDVVLDRCDKLSAEFNEERLGRGRHAHVSTFDGAVAMVKCASLDMTIAQLCNVLVAIDDVALPERAKIVRRIRGIRAVLGTAAPQTESVTHSLLKIYE